MSYRPQEFWEQRLSEQFDLRGTGETGLSLAYNKACYQLRADVLTGALQRAGMAPNNRRVLDIGCGTGFWTDYYVSRGAHYTGVDIAQVSVDRLAQRYTEQRFVRADVSEGVPGGPYDVINVFDVLYHITDDAKWQAALQHLAAALAPGGVLLVTDVFSQRPQLADHNVMRPLSRYLGVLEGAGLVREQFVPTHVLLNRHLGTWRFLNRWPGLLLVLDRTLLALGAGHDDAANKLLVCRRKA
ncbi:MAG: class I SAM-dependent methyltransferase [Candidatus Eisenbacteria bacterium]|nr:class I SAM-dependent methyltransferase [Candidatus Eisenbacteria bacterium]